MLFDRLGRSVKGLYISESYRLHTPETGAAEIDPNVLLDRTFRCIDAVLLQAGSLSDKIKGVGITTLVSNILGVDRQGGPTTPVYTYADSRAEPDAAALRTELDEKEVHDRTGCRFHTSYLPARFRWLNRTNSEVVQRTEQWLTLGEYILLKIFGQSQVSYSVASWSGLLDRMRLTWDESLLALLSISPDNLSSLTDTDQPVSGLSGKFADRWPPLRNVAWFPAIGDGAAANVGAGCVSARRIALSLGTSSALRILTTNQVDHLPPSLWCYRLDRRRALLGGALTEGGNIFAWMTRILNVDRKSDLNDALSKIPPDSHGLTLLPFLAGERSPGWVGDAQGAINGLSLNTTPLHILRAGLEAVALRLAIVFEDLLRFIPDVEMLVASGGAIVQSSIWLQIISDALGQPVAASGVTEASSRGVALVVLEALGLLPDLDSAPVPLDTVYQPDHSHHQRYRSALSRQKDLYRKLIETSG
jgi:gluconokinase